MRRIVVIALLTLLTAAIAFPGPVGAAQQGRELMGVTRFSGDRSGATVVRLPRDVEVSSSPFNNKFISIRSTGRIAGLVLKQDVPKDAIEIVALSVALCPRPPCEEKRLAFTAVWDPAARGFPRKTTLPAGDYFVYLIAERETEVDVRLPALTGEGALPLNATDAIDIAEPQTTFDPLPQHNVYSAEAKQHIEGLGWAVMAIEMEADSQIYGEISTCLQREKADPVMQHASVPFMFSSCNGSGGGSTFFGLPTGPKRDVIVSLSTVGKGTYFHGLMYKTVAEIKEMNSLALDISLPAGKRSGGISIGMFSHEE